jgi:tRNA 2-thiouridine synthesizing protein E
MAAAAPVRSRVLRVVAGSEVWFDDEGFFWDPDDWTEVAAQELARDRGMAGLDAVQWRVLQFMRRYYLDHGRAPMHRELRAGTEMSLVELERLFPDGIKLGARLLAGLPNPKTCLD